MTSDSKQGRMVDLLQRPDGATINELMSETGWLSHSVRGAISGVLKRKLGLTVDSRVEPDRGRVYRIVTPLVLEPPAAPSRSRRHKMRVERATTPKDEGAAV